MNANSTITEADIFADVIAPNQGDLPPKVAQSVLQWTFTEQAAKRMTVLANRNSQGVITEAEREELDRYLRVGSFINIVQAKARLSLKDDKSSS